jgi:hypothetical protein
MTYGQNTSSASEKVSMANWDQQQLAGGFSFVQKIERNTHHPSMYQGAREDHHQMNGQLDRNLLCVQMP